MVELHTEQTVARFEFRTVLDSLTYTFRFDFNDRDESWYFSLWDADNNYLVTGQKVCVFTDLLRTKGILNMPQGQLVCFDSSGEGEDPGFPDLGDRCKMLYFSPGEF